MYSLLYKVPSPDRRGLGRGRFNFALILAFSQREKELKTHFKNVL